MPDAVIVTQGDSDSTPTPEPSHDHDELLACMGRIEGKLDTLVSWVQDLSEAEHEETEGSEHAEMLAKLEVVHDFVQELAQVEMVEEPVQEPATLTEVITEPEPMPEEHPFFRPIFEHA